MKFLHLDFLSLFELFKDSAGSLMFFLQSFIDFLDFLFYQVDFFSNLFLLFLVLLSLFILFLDC